MSTLLAHEWIARAGGSENVFEQMCRTFPNSQKFCLWNDDPDRFPHTAESWLGRSPLRGRKALSLPFMPRLWEQLDLSDTDSVVVSSHAFAHHLAAHAARKGIPAFAYVHSPARYIWAPELDARGQSLPGRLGRAYFQRRDRREISNGVHFAANSHFVAQRIHDAWEVDATVIYPPVDVEGIRTFHATGKLSDDDQRVVDALPAEFVLGASRLVEYKRLDSAIDAGEQLGLPVVIAGAGPDEARLVEKSMQSTMPVTFVGRVSDPLLWTLYRLADLFVFMAVEDFGIMPVEAMASGTPVLVNRVGGAAESCLLFGGGATADPSDVQDMKTGAEMAVAMDLARLRQDVGELSNKSFRQHIAKWVGEV